MSASARPAPLIVAVHIPKTGGMSFQRTLEAHFGEAYLRDDSERPLHVTPLRRRWRALRRAWFDSPQRYANVACVHGHFLAAGWSGVARQRPVRLVTWLRDPVERLASHYHYWRRSYDPHSALPLQRRVVEEDWSLERFAFARELRDVASEFLWRLPRHRLAFVGLTERYARDHGRFCREILGVERPPTVDNVNPDRERDAYLPDGALRRRIAAYHRRDHELYAWALRRGEAAP